MRFPSALSSPTAVATRVSCPAGSQLTRITPDVDTTSFASSDRSLTGTVQENCNHLAGRVLVFAVGAGPADDAVLC